MGFVPFTLQTVQDAVQESFLSAYVHLKKFDERARFSTWLTRIAINAALMKIRKNRVSREVGVEDAADGISSLDLWWLIFQVPLGRPYARALPRSDLADIEIEKSCDLARFARIVFLRYFASQIPRIK